MAVLAVTLIAAGAWALTRTGVDQTKRSEKESPTIIDITDDLGVKPMQFVTNDAYVRYVEQLAQRPIAVKDANIHLDSTVDWNTEVMTAIEFSSPSSRSYLDLTVEEIDGEESYVIDMLGPAKNCVYTQDMVIHVAFVSEPRDSADTSKPVIVRIQNNDAECPV